MTELYYDTESTQMYERNAFWRPGSLDPQYISHGNDYSKYGLEVKRIIDRIQNSKGFDNKMNSLLEE